MWCSKFSEAINRNVYMIILCANPSCNFFLHIKSIFLPHIQIQTVCILDCESLEPHFYFGCNFYTHQSIYSLTLFSQCVFVISFSKTHKQHYIQMYVPNPILLSYRNSSDEDTFSSLYSWARLSLKDKYFPDCNFGEGRIQPTIIMIIIITIQYTSFRPVG